MVFNTTFNNISVISWLSILLVEETGAPKEIHDLTQVTDKHDHIMLYQVYLLLELEKYITKHDFILEKW
jgi:hypothetical protein